MRHALGDTHRHASGAEVLAEAHVLEPSLLLTRLRCVALEPGDVHTRGNVVPGEPVPGEGEELRARLARVGPPVFHRTCPIPMMPCKLFEGAYVRVTDGMAEHFDRARWPEQVAVFFDVQYQPVQGEACLLVTLQRVVDVADAGEDVGKRFVPKFATEETGDRLRTPGIVVFVS